MKQPGYFDSCRASWIYYSSFHKRWFLATVYVGQSVCSILWLEQGFGLDSAHPEFKMDQVNSFCLLAAISITIVSLVHVAAGEGEEVVVLEYFDNMHVSNINSAVDTCSMRGGQLAGGELEMDDWDSHLMFSELEDSVTLDTYFTTSIKLDKSSGQWKYANGDLVDMTSSRALILREYKSGLGPAQPTYDCALWNPWEPFFVPSLCSDDHAFICRIPATVETVCQMKAEENLHFSGSWAGTVQTKLGVTREQCLTECTTFANLTIGEHPCWAAEYRSSEMRCLLLKSRTKPTAIPPTSRTAGVSVFYKNCKEIASFPEDTCSVLCKCDTSREIFVPQTEEELQLYVKQAAAQAKRALYVPTNNLSSTTRKKSSATDERSSSTGAVTLTSTLIS
ncbi:hypothetical protein RRG08_065119 [Elysia crispata]|uniref:Apple domain-containing protein n=1 Tax=Elysia crispata TaxID=231223 RepID=A0AAE0Z9T0_9GAST|nr:hypothetical protein RRG08_065119 [Elysia crispata]